MNVYFRGQFQKNYQKRIVKNRSLKNRFDERMLLFTQNPHNPFLNDHPLKGSKEGFRSFSVTGDIRAIYYMANGDAYFVDIGTHNQVYR